MGYAATPGLTFKFPTPDHATPAQSGADVP